VIAGRVHLSLDTARESRYRRSVTRRLDWEKSAKQEIVRTRGADPAERQSFGRPVWMSNADREKLAALGWPAGRRGRSLPQKDARALMRALRRIDVSPEDIKRIQQIADEAARRAAASRLRTKLNEGQSEALAGAAPPLPREIKVTVRALTEALDTAERRGPAARRASIEHRGAAAQPRAAGPKPTPTKLSEMSEEELAAMRQRRRERSAKRSSTKAS
jgi:hypothetical protein